MNHDGMVGGNLASTCQDCGLLPHEAGEGVAEVIWVSAELEASRAKFSR
jgi:hypothetical protein